ncbi:MAG: phenylalanine--tRNA ligase subunit beta [Gammaproteobacteria bacterium]
MKISLEWLAEWVQSGLDARELGQRLTMAGFELESITPAAPPFAGVIVAEILEATRHPQADKLQVCKVALGSDAAARAAPLQIVCGAANARAGLRTALAQVGAVLPGGLNIKSAKLRGVESAGMLCSAKELGLAETADGIVEFPADAPVGLAVRDYLKLDDEVLELAITPNRGDAMSVRGIAREVAALTGAAFNPVDCAAVADTLGDAALAARAHAELAAPAACPRFHGRVIVDVDNTRASPVWLRERLRRAGLRSISPVVDITNYIVLELGQPMHAYDLDKIAGQVRVRRAQTGERCDLLDGRSVELTPDVLVIADTRGPVAMAGVMGGERTAVSAATRRVLFEVAWFAPAAIAGRGRRYGLTTDACQRFERGVDPQVGAQAIERASALLLQIAGGKAGATVTTEVPTSLPARAKVTLRVAQVERLLGVKLSVIEITGLLTRLGMSVTDTGASAATLEVLPPAHRFDIAIERDLIEEVARLIGYERIPTAPARAAQRIMPQPSARLEEQRLLDVLAARGYYEGVHFAFVDPVLQETLFPGVAAHRLANPIASDLAIMRVSLWPGLIKAALENQRRQQTRVRLFEHGVVFPVGEPEIDRIAAIAMGTRWPEQWGGGREAGEFHDLRADLDALLSLSGDAGAFTFVPAAHSALHPGRSSQILRAGQPVGWIGELHPRLVRELGFVTAPTLFELDIARALAVGYAPYVEVSRFPQVRRDLAFVVDESISFDAIRERVTKAASSLLKQLLLFDVYRGPGIESGRKSIALGLILQEKDRTLTDEDTDRVIAAVRASLGEGLGAQFRE